MRDIRDIFVYAIVTVSIICFVTAIILFAVTLRKKMKLKPIAKEPQTAVLPHPGASAPVAASLPLLILGNASHIGDRDSQQDSFCISDIFNEELVSRKGVLGVVADGMGGMSDGAEISSIVTRTMLTRFNEQELTEKPEHNLFDMVYAANKEILNFMSTRQGDGGSTVVATHILGNKLFWISVGDSHIYLLRNNQLLQINRDHNYASDLDEKAAAGELSWEEAINHPNRAALTSYLGIENLELIDQNLQPIELQYSDRVLLMSDGIFGTLSESEILEAMVAVPQNSAERLLKMTLTKKKPHQDNLTVVIFEYRV